METQTSSLTLKEVGEAMSEYDGFQQSIYEHMLRTDIRRFVDAFDLSNENVLVYYFLKPDKSIDKLLVIGKNNYTESIGEHIVWSRVCQRIAKLFDLRFDNSKKAIKGRGIHYLDQYRFSQDTDDFDLPSLEEFKKRIKHIARAQEELERCVAEEAERVYLAGSLTLDEIIKA